ncbi:hypothetical protein ACS0TY_020852 [Phlomoides rotata]
MQPPHNHSRINLAELKAQLVKKLGPEGSKQYFYYLSRFLSLKVNKVEFNKLCLRIVGRENIPLHNQLIRSILRNACTAKTPPAIGQKDDLKHGAQFAGKEIPADVYQQNGSHSGSPGLPNGGDMLPLSPRKARTGRGRPRSALGPNGKTSFAPQLSTATQSNDFNVVLENGDLNPPDHVRPRLHHQGLIQQMGNESETLVPHAASQDQIELVVGDNGKEASARSPLRAPLGVPYYSGSIGGVHRPSSSSTCIGTLNDIALLDSLTLRERMEQIAVIQGLEGVSLDCANILNHGLDTYLKGLIRSCIELVGSRSGHELTKNNMNKNQGHVKLINGVKPGHQYQMQNSGRKELEVPEQRNYCPISLQDFRVAMELNPQRLGEDWPLLLEKICTRSFEE